MLNQLDWFILIKHIGFYHNKDKYYSFTQLIGEIKEWEMFSFIVTLCTYIAFITVVVMLEVVRSLDNQLKNSADTFLDVVLILVSILLVISEIVIFKNLGKEMKYRLNYFYKNQYKKLKVIPYVNIEFYFIYFLYHL